MHMIEITHYIGGPPAVSSWVINSYNWYMYLPLVKSVTNLQVGGPPCINHYYQPLSTINHYQSLLLTTSHYQPLLFTTLATPINWYLRTYP